MVREMPTALPLCSAGMSGPHALHSLELRHLRCFLAIAEEGNVTRAAALTRGAVDVALLRGPVDTPGLVTELLHTESRVAAVPSDSPLAARATLTLADLRPHTIAVNTVSGTTALDLWPPGARPT